ncbi:putative MFS siderophore transporter [Xylariales sp. PMI_506]|nr:putative MFS siderophore transporter [Xylariales sp. PMI_506]
MEKTNGETKITPQDVEAGNDGNEKREPTANVQSGVSAAEAMTTTWTKTSLAISYICFWLLYFTNAFQSSITSNLTPYVISDFSAHSLIPTIAVVCNVMSAATYLPQAKLLDIWGRPLGFALMAGLATLGLVLMATCQGIYTYCAAQVFYSVGFVGVTYSVDVMTADSSSLRDRGLAFAFTSSPYIITAFAGPAAAEDFWEDGAISWRWGFGVWAIVLPVVALPLFLTMQLAQNKARSQGLIKKELSGRTWWQSFIHYCVEFDIIGIILLAFGLVLLLLPFSIAASAEDEWASGGIIAMLVVGVVCLIAFGIFEKWFSPKPFIPYHLLLDRTIIGACLMGATYQVAYYCWNGYFSSYLQVVYNASIEQAGWIGNIFDVVAGVWLLVVGWLIKFSGRYRWLGLIAVPVYILFVGLLIYFRQPTTPIGFIVMSEIFIALAGGTMIIVEQVSVMAVVEHQNVAAVLALLGLFGYIGGAVGSSISGAVWTNTLPYFLQQYLPSESLDIWQDIYDDLDMQLSFEWGSPTRDAIIQAYAQAQTRMLIAGTVIMGLSLIWVMMIKNIKVSDIQQVKGVLF